MEKLKILFCGDSLNYNSGLSYLSKSFLQKFYDTGKYDIGYITLSGDDSVKNQSFPDIQIFNAQVLDKKKSKVFDEVIVKFRPDIVISFVDPWILDPIAYSRYKLSFFWIAYLTIETPEYPDFVTYPTPINPQIRKSLRNILMISDLLIPCTPMGFENLKKLKVKPSPYIFPGLDVEKEIKIKINKKMAFGNTVNDDSFIFMTVGVNSDRKGLAKIVESFDKFLKKIGGTKDKYKLYIHSDLNRNQGGTDLRGMISALNINKNVLIPAIYTKNIGISRKELFEKYKASDCYIGLAAGEGWGYGYLESMLHGKPLVYIDYGGHLSFCKDAGLPVKVKDYFYSVGGYIKFALPDTDDAAKQMARMVSDKKIYNKLSIKGKAIVNTFTWEKSFKELEKNILNEYNKWNTDPLIKFNLKREI